MLNADIKTLVGVEKEILKQLDGLLLKDTAFADSAQAMLWDKLSQVRKEAVEIAELELKNDPRNAAHAVLRRMYKGRLAGNINIATNRRRLEGPSSYQEPRGGRDGIKRTRTVKGRTEQLRQYQGADRSFILRILASGRNEYRATSDGPVGRGSMATYGRRGSIGSRVDVIEASYPYMERASEELGRMILEEARKQLDMN